MTSHAEERVGGLLKPLDKRRCSGVGSQRVDFLAKLFQINYLAKSLKDRSDSVFPHFLKFIYGSIIYFFHFFFSVSSSLSFL